MKPAVARALLSVAALGALGGGGSGIEQPGFERRRARPEPWRAPTPFPSEPIIRWQRPSQSSPVEDIERFRLADEKRARKAAKLEAAAAKGAIRRAKDSDAGRHGAQGDPATTWDSGHETPTGDRA